MRGVDELLDLPRVLQVSAHLTEHSPFNEFGPQFANDAAQVVRAPRLVMVVRAVVVDEHAGAQAGKGEGHGEPDPAAS